MNIPQTNHPADLMKIGENIRRWRKEKGIKKHDFAKNLHISTKILRRVEQDKVGINHLQVRIIAGELKIKFGELLIDPGIYYQIHCELSFN